MNHARLRVLCGASLLVLASIAPVAAHAEFESATPGPNDVIDVVPSELVAHFSQDLAADRTSIELHDASGQTLATGRKDPNDPRVQRMALPPLQPGVYEVRWVSFSAEDNELDRGIYQFTVVAPTAQVEPAQSLAPCPSTMPVPDTSAVPLESAEPAAMAEPCQTPAASTSPEASAAPEASMAP